MFTDRCHVTFEQFFAMYESFSWAGCRGHRMSLLLPCVSSNLSDGSVLHGYKCTSDICLRTCRGHSSHLCEVSVCRGLSPHPWVTSADFSHNYLPVKSFIPLITGQWLYQQTASGVFLHAFTQIKWIIVVVDFGASFLM